MNHKGIWTGVVSVIVIAAIGFWWLSESHPLDTIFDFPTNSAQTPGTQNDTTSRSVTVKRVRMTNRDVVTIVKGLSNASSFNTYFKSTGVAATIGTASVSKYTIFVPTNGAFAQLAPGTISSMTTAEKKRLVQYHVVSGRAVDVDAQSAGTIEALSRDVLNFSYAIDGIPMVNSAIVSAQYEGKNGIVIVIDNVLLPPKKTN